MQDAVKMNNNKQVELLTDEDYSVLNEIYEKEGKISKKVFNNWLNAL